MLHKYAAHLQKWRALVKFLSLFSLCLFLAISCGRQESAPPASTNQAERITIGMTSKIRTLDPADAYENASGTLLYNMGERLYTYEPGTTTLKPQLATELPKISADGLTYTIPLRRGVIFHDGTTFNAEAMAFSLKRFIENQGNPSALLSNTVESIKAIDDYQLEIKLKKPFAAFPKLLTFSGACAISPKAYEIGAGKFKPDTFVGTGAYKLAKYGTDSIQLDVFEQYWGEKPANKGIDIQIFSSSSNLYNTFRTGGVDIAYQSMDLEQIASLEKEAASTGWQVISQPSKGIYYLTINIKSKPLDNLAVRQALAAAISRPLLKERVFKGQVEPLYSLVSQTLKDVYKPTFKEKYGDDANVTKVTEYLRKAGYSKDNPLTLDLWYRSNLTSNSLAATTLKAAFEQKLGGAIKLNLQGVESTTAYNNLDKGVYPLFILDWSPDFLDADNYIEPFIGCSKGSEATGCEEGSSKQQGSFYYSERANKLIDKQRQEQNPEARQKIFAELQELIASDVPFIPLWQGKDYLFAQKNLQGVRLEPTQQLYFGTLTKTVKS